jgi:hypothetical protein
MLAARTQTPSLKAEILPIYLCPGIRQEPFTLAVFPYGSGFTVSRTCPMREVCHWYEAFDAQPDQLDGLPLLPGRFQLRPFKCADFRDRPRRRKIA